MESVSAVAGRWVARAMVLGLLAAAALTWAGSPASAHGQLALSTPVKDSTLSAPLAKLELYFTEPPATFAHFTVTAPSGLRVDAGWTSGNPKRLDKPVQEYHLVNGEWQPKYYNEGFPALLAVSHWPERGKYSATYLSVASDGEPVKGSLAFTYKGPTTAAPTGWTAPIAGPSDILRQAVDGTGPTPRSLFGTPPATAGGDAAASTATKPAADAGGGFAAWILPALLVVVAGVVVVAAARRRPTAEPARRPGPARGAGGRAGARKRAAGRVGPPRRARRRR